MSGYGMSARLYMRDAEAYSRTLEGLAGQTVYYVGGGVYRVSWGTRVRGAQAAKDWLRENRPDFYGDVERGLADRMRRERDAA